MSMPSTTATPRAIADLPLFMPFFSDEEGFAAVYPELFADPALGLLRVEGFGPTKVAAFRNDHLRRLMVHPALSGNTPPGMLARQAFFSIAPEAGQEDHAHAAAVVLERYLANQVFTMNPPLHKAYRPILARHMMGAALETHAPRMRGIVDELVARASGRGPVDFFSDVSGLVAARFWADLIGMTAQEEVRVVTLMHDILAMFKVVMDHADLVRAGTAMNEYMELVSGAVERSLQQGGNPLLETIAAEFEQVRVDPGDPETAGRPPESVGRMVASNLFDGFHTAGAAAANCVYRLFTHPEALQRVREDRSLVAAAAFEGLRLDPPLTLSQRFVLEDTVFDGVALPQGTQVVMLWGAGNRDPQAYPDPDRYDLARPQRGGVSFGGGVRMCMGRSVAQLLIETVLSAVTAPGVELTLTSDDHHWLPLSLMRQLQRLPVVIRGAA